MVERAALMLVFGLLGPMDLARCSLVCRAWTNVSADPILWRKMDLSGKRLTGACLMSIVRKQPETLVLGFYIFLNILGVWIKCRCLGKEQLLYTS